MNDPLFPAEFRHKSRESVQSHVTNRSFDAGHLIFKLSESYIPLRSRVQLTRDVGCILELIWLLLGFFCRRFGAGAVTAALASVHTKAKLLEVESVKWERKQIVKQNQATMGQYNGNPAEKWGKLSLKGNPMLAHVERQTVRHLLNRHRLSCS